MWERLVAWLLVVGFGVSLLLDKPVPLAIAP
ncbi:hypothetical protein HRbin40_00326 [bacterium HR40]|nr:hypothetical protein HRbin40_00326 [bacterium HR40]